MTSVESKTTMALVHRYSAELSSRSGSIDKLLNDVTEMKRQDENEKHYLHSLNDRLEELVRNLEDLENSNKRLRDELSSLISGWGIGGEFRQRFLNELDRLIGRLSEESRRKLIHQAERRIIDDQVQLVDRLAVVFGDTLNLYKDKSQILNELIQELEEEFRQVRRRLDVSDDQIKSHDGDYRAELDKFRSYLREWSQLSMEKQSLLNEIQSLKERYNLRLAYNQEEINEWQRLLNRISQESKNFYRDYLDTIKQKIQLDYEQMAKEQQTDVEFRLKSNLREVEQKFELLSMNENGFFAPKFDSSRKIFVF